MAGENLSEEDLKRAERGNGMVVEFRRGKGRVFHAGTTEWLVGLQPRRVNGLSADDDPNGDGPSSVRTLGWLPLPGELTAVFFAV